MGAFKINSAFQSIAEDVTRYAGIQLGEKQKALIETRLTKRVRELGLKSPEEYQGYYNEHKKEEFQNVVSLLTTHHTFFFREFKHFEYLIEDLPRMIESVKSQGRNSIDIWCAACSYGHEVYSLAMFFNFHLKHLGTSIKFNIFGSDVDQKCVKFSNNGVYKWDDLKKSPSHYIGKCWTRGTGEISAFVKARSEIKDSCSFGVVNLFDSKTFPKGKSYDYIFCRNVFIYFTEKQITDSANNLSNHLQPHGKMIIGISETLGNYTKMIHLGASVYAKEESVKHQSKPAKVIPISPEAQNQGSTVHAAPSLPQVASLPNPLKVLVVDDSKTVLTVLKKILSSAPGIEVVGTAMNGIEAHEFIKNNKVDVMTLDIHMPEMDGVQYLKTHFKEGHPPVTMISSVSRENSELALNCLNYGATDYVEKPTLQNLSDKKDEIITKLKNSYLFKGFKSNQDLSSQFKRSQIITNTDKKLRIIYGGIPDRDRIQSVLNSTRYPFPPTVVVFDTDQTFIERLCDSDKSNKAVLYKPGSEIHSNRIYYVSKDDFGSVPHLCREKKTVTLFFSGATKQMADQAKSLNNNSIVYEDLGTNAFEKELGMSGAAKVWIPYTSFAYESEKFLTEEEE